MDPGNVEVQTNYLTTNRKLINVYRESKTEFLVTISRIIPNHVDICSHKGCITQEAKYDSCSDSIILKSI